MSGFAAAAVGAYLVAILAVGVLSRRARRSDSLADFYLAARDLGGFTLLLTLYATQFSGNTLLGYPGEAYRQGFAWVMSAGFMTAIIVVYLLFAPRLHVHAKRFGYVTPGDWVAHRFGSPALALVANVLMVVALANYLLAQLMAMGHVAAGLSGGSVPYWAGVVVFTLVIIVYETLGGMRAVAWTDGGQGLMLIAGLGGILLAVTPTPAHLADVTRWIMEHEPAKAALPSADTTVTWASTLVLIGFSAAVYPHAIQRVYAARSLGTLRRSLAVMAFMPLVTTVPVFLIGIVSIQQLSGLEGTAADRVMPLLMANWAAQSPLMYALALLVMLAVLAAIMSTADSVLLTLSSILAKDLFGPWLLPGAPEARLTSLGKKLSWAVVAALVAVAVAPRITLWGLIELKMELLIQVSPLFVLGVTWPRLGARGALSGLCTGVAISVALPVLGYPRPLGIHAGVIGWAANLLICRASAREPARRSSRERAAAGS